MNQHHHRWLFTLAAVLGASFGALAVRSYVAACSCVEHEWSLELVDTDEPDAAAWAEHAELLIDDSTRLHFSSYKPRIQLTEVR